MEHTTANDVSVPGNGLQDRKYCVAVTGDVFRWMIDYGNEDVLSRVSLPLHGPAEYLLIIFFHVGFGMRESLCPYVAG